MKKADLQLRAVNSMGLGKNYYIWDDEYGRRWHIYEGKMCTVNCLIPTYTNGVRNIRPVYFKRKRLEDVKIALPIYAMMEQ